MTLNGKTAIVTGGSKGIGAAIGRRLAADGARVVVNYANGKAQAEEVAGGIVAAGGSAVAARADLATPEGMRRLFDEAEAAFGTVDILVNNAGAMTLAPLAEVEDEAFDRMVALNLGGVFRGMREAGRRLAEGGRVVNFSSTVVGLLQPRYGVYAATKAAVEAMTHIFAKEMGPRRITVNAVAPGPVATELYLSNSSAEQAEMAARMNPLGRLGQPDDIGRVVAFLCSDEGGWINGQVVRANGGVA